MQEKNGSIKSHHTYFPNYFQKRTKMAKSRILCVLYVWTGIGKASEDISINPPILSQI